MKILIAVHHFPPTYTAGAEQEAYQFASGLQKLGHEVRIICVENIHDGSTSGISWVDTDYAGLPVRRLSYNLNSIPDQDQFEYDNPWIGEQVSALLTAFQPDIFHLVSGYLITGRSIRIAKEFGIPTVISLEDFWFLCKRITLMRSDGTLSTLPIDPIACVQCLGEQKRRYRIPGSIVPGLMQHYWETQKDQAKAVEDRIRFQNETLRQADLLIGRSKFLTTTYIQAGVDPERIIFSRQGMDTSIIASGTKQKSMVPYLRIGYIGQIAGHKGVHIIIDAVKKLVGMPIQVKIYGKADAFPRYTRQLLKKAGSDNRIEFAGSFQRQDLPQVMAGLDILVVPSLWYENSPNVILEAFANKIPVIASNLGGMAELVQDGRTGLLFETGNADDLAQKIRHLWETPDILNRLSENIPPVKTIEADVEELVDRYRNLIFEHQSVRINGD